VGAACCAVLVGWLWRVFATVRPDWRYSLAWLGAVLGVVAVSVWVL